jgi:integrase
MSASLHLVRRGNTFHFRIAVPRELVERIGKVEIKTTLKTADLLTAKQRSRVLSSAIEALFEEVRRMPELTRQHVDRFVRIYFQDCLDKSQELAATLPKDKRSWDRDSEVAYLRKRIETLKVALADRYFSPAFECEVLEILHPEAPKPEKGDLETFEYACALVLRAKIQDAMLLVAELMGEPTRPTDPVFEGMRALRSPPLPGEVRTGSSVVIHRAGAVDVEDDAITHSDLFSLYCKHMASRNITPRTLQEMQRAHKLASEVIEPSRPINRISGRDVREVRDLILQLPRNIERNGTFKGMTLAQAARANANVAALVIDFATQRKLFGFFIRPLRWALKDHHITAMPGGSISIPDNRTLEDTVDGRKPYDEAGLRLIFSSPLFTGCTSESRRATPGKYLFKDGRYWVPLLALYTGMRLSEIVQLATEDVRQEQGIWLIDIRLGTIAKTGEVKRVKKKSSIRIVPLHDDLIQLGILDVVHRAEAGGRLFPELRFAKDGTASKNFSKFWSRYGKALGFRTGDHVFHSLRHNMADMTRDAELHIEASTFLMGHKLPGTRSRYGKGMSLAPLKEQMDKVRPPIDLVALLEEAQHGKIDITGTEWGSRLHIRRRPRSLTSPKPPSNLLVRNKGRPRKTTQPPKDQSPS